MSKTTDSFLEIMKLNMISRMNAEATMEKRRMKEHVFNKAWIENEKKNEERKENLDHLLIEEEMRKEESRETIEKERFKSRSDEEIEKS